MDLVRKKNQKKEYFVNLQPMEEEEAVVEEEAGEEVEEEAMKEDR